MAANLIYRQTSADPGRSASSVKALPLSNAEVDGNFKEIDMELALKANKDSETLTGTPKAPTVSLATGGATTTSIATTGYVASKVADYAPTKTGTGATGSWGISITGSSASCTGNAANVTGIVAIANGGTGTTTGTVPIATTATGANTVIIASDTTLNSTVYPTWTPYAGSSAYLAVRVSSTKLTFNPSTGVLSSTSFNSTSDANLKTNIIPLVDALSYVSKLNGVSFDWKDGTGSSYGMVAQEVEKVLPHAVSDNGSHKSINYSAVIPFLLESIKELQARIILLENK